MFSNVYAVYQVTDNDERFPAYFHFKLFAKRYVRSHANKLTELHIIKINRKQLFKYVTGTYR